MRRSLIFQILHRNTFNKKTGPRIIKAYKKLESDKSSTDGYLILLLGHARSPFRDLETYLRCVVGLDEVDIQKVSKQGSSHFVTLEMSPGFYSIKYFSEAVYNVRDHEGTIQFEYHGISSNKKTIWTRFGLTFGVLTFDEKSFFKTMLGFTSFWLFTLTNAIHVDSSGV